MTLINITAQEKRARQEQERRNAAVEMAQDVLRSQMFNAQKIAGLLGEATAVTKMAVTKLLVTMQENSYEEAAEESAEPEIREPGEPVNAVPVFPEGMDDLPAVVPAAKPKLKINTRYAKPAPASSEKGGEQRGAAADSL